MQSRSASDFLIAYQNPGASFAEQMLRETEPEKRGGRPWITAGSFAAVCRMNSSKGSWAVRCFLRDVEDLQRRYGLISEYLQGKYRSNTALLDFKYSHKGVLLAGEWRPIVIMDWVDGSNLDYAVGSMIFQEQSLEGLLESWISLDSELVELGVSHGDLQHGNVMIGREGLRLVDYDGMCVPAIEGERSNESGHRNYRNPRTSVAVLDDQSDRFSSLLIYTALYAVHLDNSLWNRFQMDNAILFREEDLSDPIQSELFNELKSSDDRKLRSLIDMVLGDLQSPGELGSLESILRQIEYSRTWFVHPQQADGSVGEQARLSKISWLDKVKAKLGLSEGHESPVEQARPSWMRDAFNIDPRVDARRPERNDQVEPATLPARTMSTPLPGWIASTRSHSQQGVTPSPVPPSGALLQKSLLKPVLVASTIGGSSFPAAANVFGNRQSYKYHLRECRWLPKDMNSRWVEYVSAEAAESRGFTACQFCLDLVETATRLGASIDSRSSASVSRNCYVEIGVKIGKDMEFRIVEHKTSSHSGTVLVSSALGAALIGRKLGDTVSFPDEPIFDQARIISIRQGA